MKKNRVHSLRENMEPKRLGVFSTVWTVIVLYAVTVIQSSVVSYVTSGGAAVDIIVTTAVMLSIYTNECYGAVMGVSMGAVFDMLNSSRVPVMPIVMLFICAYCGFMYKNMKKGSFILKGIAVISANLIRYGLTFLLEMGRNTTVSDQLLRSVLPGLGISILLSPIIMIVCCPAARGSLFDRKLK